MCSPTPLINTEERGYFTRGPLLLIGIGNSYSTIGFHRTPFSPWTDERMNNVIQENKEVYTMVDRTHVAGDHEL